MCCELPTSYQRLQQLDRYWAHFPETRQNPVANGLALLSSLDSERLAGDERVELPHTEPESAEKGLPQIRIAVPVYQRVTNPLVTASSSRCSMTNRLKYRLKIDVTRLTIRLKHCKHF